MGFMIKLKEPRMSPDQTDDIILDDMIIHDGRQSQRAAEIQRGTCRMFKALGMASLSEVSLSNSRRADIVAVGRKADLWIVEIKSSLQDYRTDGKWPSYGDYCDQFFFAVAQDFPRDVLPDHAGLIIADRYNAEIIRMPDEHRLSAARRKAMLLKFAHLGALRLQGLLDPPSGSTIQNF